MRTEMICLARMLLGSLLVASLGCGSSRSKQTLSLRPDIGEVPPELRSDFESFKENCSKCHDLDRALAAPVTDNRHWDIYVAKMMRTAGSAISEREAPYILRFLYWYTDRKTRRTTDSAKTSEPSPQPAPEHVPSNKEDSSTSAPTAPQPAAVTTETEGESTP